MSTNTGANTNNIPLLLNNIEARLGELGPSTGFVRNPMITTLLANNFAISGVSNTQSETLVTNQLEVALGATPGQTLFIHNQANLLNYGADDAGNNTIGDPDPTTLTTFQGKVTFNIPPTLTLVPVALANPQTEYNVLVDTSLPQVFVVKDSFTSNSTGLNGTSVTLWNSNKTLINTINNTSVQIDNGTNISTLSGSQLDFTTGIYNTVLDNSGLGSFIAGTVGNDITVSCGSTSTAPGIAMTSQIPSVLGLSELDNRSLKFTLGATNSTFNLNGVSSNEAVTLTSGSSNSINLNSDGDITLSPGTSSAFNTVIMNNLPTSSSGLSVGSLWNNGGVLNIV
jgi:hypothetical protein